MKKEFIQSIKIIVLGLVIGLSVSIVSAVWAPPSGTPSESTNAPEPINVGTELQVKMGGLSVDAFLADLDARFETDVTLWQFHDGPANDRYLCVNGAGEIKICGVATIPALSGSLSVLQSVWPHENYRIGANISGGTAPRTCAWSGNASISGLSNMCSHVDFGGVTGTLNVQLVVTDSSTPVKTQTISGSFSGGALVGGTGSN